MKKSTFSEVLDGAGNLSLEEREELIELLHKRTIEEHRAELSKEIRSSRNDYKRGRCTAASSKDIIKEILP